nr:hypothetical protein [Micromonospora sp. DSM 115978]
MPAAPAPRRPAPAALRALAASTVVALLLTGCQTLDDAGQVIGRADLVNDLASRLDQARELTYSAEYQLPDGESASIVQSQRPLRAAYVYPGGRLTVTPEATTECEADGSRQTCVLNPPPEQTDRPSVTLFERAGERGLVTPPVVVGLLTAAALDPDAVIEQNDTTVAGRHATCVDVSQVTNAPAASFQTCVTTEGVLGSFTGVVDGREVDLAMSRFRSEVESTAFDLPADAGVVDRRPENQ